MTVDTFGLYFQLSARDTAAEMLKLIGRYTRPRIVDTTAAAKKKQ
jgi:hypothetical protein